jgi:3-oxoacyl-[acyl-carrier protein] reductase
MPAKVALVTGSSHGIGRAIAEAFVGAGYRVAFNGRDKERLTATVTATSSSNAIALPGDVTVPNEARTLVARTLEAFGQLDVLVCNVGSGRSVPPGQETQDEWMRMLSLNLLSTTNMVEASQHALASSCGNVVCISSICGQEVISGAPITYSAAKAALNAYIRGMARPLGLQRVRINGVAPGNILFPGSVWERKLAENADGVQLMLDQNVALRQLGTPQNVAELALWLSSPAAEFVTGSIYVVDGGQVRT